MDQHKDIESSTLFHEEINVINSEIIPSQRTFLDSRGYQQLFPPKRPYILAHPGKPPVTATMTILLGAVVLEAVQTGLGFGDNRIANRDQRLLPSEFVSIRYHLSFACYDVVPRLDGVMVDCII